MIRHNLIYGITDNEFVIIGNNNYNYANDEIILGLMKKYGKIIIDNDYNKKLDFLPEGIYHLIIGCQFNHELNNLPSTLKILEIRKVFDVGYCNFNQSIDNLPFGLEELYISYNKCFKQSLRNLPSSLKIFELYNYNNIDEEIKYLSDNIEVLFIKTITNIELITKIPNNLKKFIKPYGETGNFKILEDKFPNIEFLTR